jgi:hypothetical protein
MREEHQEAVVELRALRSSATRCQGPGAERVYQNIFPSSVAVFGYGSDLGLC